MITASKFRLRKASWAALRRRVTRAPRWKLGEVSPPDSGEGTESAGESPVGVGTTEVPVAESEGKGDTAAEGVPDEAAGAAPGQVQATSVSPANQIQARKRALGNIISSLGANFRGRQGTNLAWRMDKPIVALQAPFLSLPPDLLLSLYLLITSPLHPAVLKFRSPPLSYRTYAVEAKTLAEPVLNEAEA